MKQVVEGIFNEGKIILNETVPFTKKSKVLVIFLEDYEDKAIRKEQLLKTFGSWKDDRDAEEIVEDIYSSRVSRRKDIYHHHRRTSLWST